MEGWGEPPELEPEDYGDEVAEEFPTSPHPHLCRACGCEWMCADPPGMCPGGCIQEECSYCGREDEREESDREREGRF